MTQYRIIRLLISIISLFTNKIAMRLQRVYCGTGFRCCGSITFRNFGTTEIGNDIYINSHRLADPIGGDSKTILCTGKSAKIKLHDKVSISNATIYANKYIEVGEQTCIGGSVKIYDTDFHSIYAEKRLNGNIDVPTSPVVIGKRVFVGGHSIILKGVTIGDEAVIGAGSVVTKSIPAKEVWAGNPAKFIKKIE